MPPEETTETETTDETAVDSSVEVEQDMIDWTKLVTDELSPDNGESDDGEKQELVEDETGDEGEGEGEGEGETQPDGPDAFGEADYERKVAVKTKSGGTEYKTIRQLIDEGLMEADYTRGKQKLKTERGRLEEDKNILSLIDKDPQARDYLLKRFEDVKAGKGVSDDDFDIGLSPEELAQFPWIGKLVDKVKINSNEMAKYRDSQKQSQANQTVNRLEKVMETAQTVIEKETNLKLKPGEFRARVGNAVLNALDDALPEDQRVLIGGQLILTDKDYYLAKARVVYQQERELAKEKTVTEAHRKKAKGAQKTSTLTSGGKTTTAGSGSHIVKDAKGNTDITATIEEFYKQGNKGVR